MPRAFCATLAVLIFAACGGDSEPPPEYPPVDPDPLATAEPVSAETEAALPSEPPPPPIQIVAAERTPIEGTAPTLRITVPRNGQTVRGNVSLRINVRNWELAPAPGKHVHVIVDNEPYIAVRDVRRPLNLNELVQENLGHELTPGTHVVRVFPSRNHHESVKESSAFAMVMFHYQEATEGFEFDANAPVLTYSRPKGCVTVGERVLLDFFVTNVDELAADGTRVRYSVGEVSGDITTWAPHYIENLPAGEHPIRLMLVGADGQPVAGPFNDTTRTITVAESCGAPPPPPAEEAESDEGASE